MWTSRDCVFVFFYFFNKFTSGFFQPFNQSLCTFLIFVERWLCRIHKTVESFRLKPILTNIESFTVRTEWGRKINWIENWYQREKRYFVFCIVNYLVGVSDTRVGCLLFNAFQNGLSPLSHTLAHARTEIVCTVYFLHRSCIH